MSLNKKLDKIMQNVRVDWKRLFREYGIEKLLKSTLEQVLTQDKTSNITPALENIMTWATFNLSDIKIVICGQDPYYSVDKKKRRVAHGLAFSTLDLNKCPPSLASIYESLVKDKLIETPPIIHNLTNWSKQGVLLLNTALTTRIGEANAHVNIWTSFTNKLFLAISEHFAVRNKRLIYMLWGKTAQKKMFNIDSIHEILTTAHPSPMAQRSIINEDEKFVNCRHFSIANTKLEQQDDKGINWNTVIEHVIYTDGSCNLNPYGKGVTKGFKANEDSQASWAYIIHNGPFKGNRDSGMVKIATDVPIILKDAGTGKITKTKYIAYPTSIRSEGIALIKALLYIYNTQPRYTGKIIIKCDCNHWVKAFNKYKWITTNRKLINVRNLDIVIMLRQINAKIDEKIGVLIVKGVKAAHERKRPEDINSTDYDDWSCNDVVDKIAKSTLRTFISENADQNTDADNKDDSGSDSDSSSGSDSDDDNKDTDKDDDKNKKINQN